MKAYSNLMGELSPHKHQLIPEPIKLTSARVKDFKRRSKNRPVHIYNKLNTGDRIPDVFWDLIFPVVSNKTSKGQEINLAEFKNNRIILNFFGGPRFNSTSSIDTIHLLQKAAKKFYVTFNVIEESEENLRALLHYSFLSIPFLLDNGELKGFFSKQDICLSILIEDNVVKAMEMNYWDLAESLSW